MASWTILALSVYKGGNNLSVHSHVVRGSLWDLQIYSYAGACLCMEVGIRPFTMSNPGLP